MNLSVTNLSGLARCYDVTAECKKDYAIKKEIIEKMLFLISVHHTFGMSQKHFISELILLFEGLRLEAYYEETGQRVEPETYDDTKLISIGYGFNMNFNSAEKWKGKLDRNLFEDFKQGKKPITPQQAYDLLQHALEERLKILEKMFGTYWEKLPVNIKIALQSIYYNVPCIFQARYGFRESLMLFCQDGQTRHLLVAGQALLKYQHKRMHQQLQHRRKLECLMICGTDELESIEKQLSKQKSFLDWN